VICSFFFCAIETLSQIEGHLMKKQFLANIEKDIPNMVDAVFIDDHDESGIYVLIAVNDKGRAMVDASLPGFIVKWGSSVFLKDWHEVVLEVMDDLAESAAQSLAVDVVRQGGRAAIIQKAAGRSRPYVRIIQKHAGH
jgi:hypothetical protein